MQDVGGIIDLGGWRREHEAVELRLERAVLALDEVMDGKERRDVPAWVVTEVFAIQGCISMDLLEEAAERAEKLVHRWKRLAARRGAEGG